MPGSDSLSVRPTCTREKLHPVLLIFMDKVSNISSQLNLTVFNFFDSISVTAPRRPTTRSIETWRQNRTAMPLAALRRMAQITLGPLSHGCESGYPRLRRQPRRRPPPNPCRSLQFPAYPRIPIHLHSTARISQHMPIRPPPVPVMTRTPQPCIDITNPI